MDRLQRIAKSMQPKGGIEAVGVPKYVALYNRLLASIESGDWKPGDQLPPETELARFVPVSLGTVQKALRMLADHGIVVRRHGHGTFVAGAPATKNAAEIRNFRFLADDGKSLLPLYTRVLAIEATKEKGPWSRFFVDEVNFVRITRLVNVNLEFQNYCRLYLPASRFGVFLKYGPHDLDGAAVTHLLTERFNAPTLRFVHHLRAIDLPSDTCKILNVSIGSSGHEWEMFGYTYRNAPITYQHVYMPAHERRLELRDSPIE